jgi:peptide/nickel transport system permease protein
MSAVGEDRMGEIGDAVAAHAPGVVVPARPVRLRSPLRRVLDRWPLIVVAALAWLVAMVVVALAADSLAPYSYTTPDLRGRLLPPAMFGGSARHWLGTDELGRDVLSRLISSIRMSILVALVATFLSAAIGVVAGFVAAHFRGLVDDVVMGLADMQASLPFLIIALAVLAFFGTGIVLFVCLMAFSGWERYARITRGLAIAAGEQGYARAVRQLGASPLRVWGAHVLPNIAGTLLVTMTLNFPEIILLETGLSFLGLGVQPPATSLGNMIGYGRDYLQTAPWILLAPSVVLVLTTLSISVAGDWLRDRLDPTLE